MKEEEKTEQTNWENILDHEESSALVPWVDIVNDNTTGEFNSLSINWASRFNNDFSIDKKFSNLDEMVSAETSADLSGLYLNAKTGLDFSHGFTGSKYDFANQFFGDVERLSNWKDIDTCNSTFDNFDYFSGFYKRENDFLGSITASYNYNSSMHDQGASKELDAFIPQRFCDGRNYSEVFLAGDGNFLSATEDALMISHGYSNPSEIALAGFDFCWEVDSQRDYFTDSFDHGLLMDKEIVDPDTAEWRGTAGSNSIYLNSDAGFYCSYSFAGCNINSVNQDEVHWINVNNFGSINEVEFGLFNQEENYYNNQTEFENFVPDKFTLDTVAYVGTDYSNASFVDLEQSENQFGSFDFSLIDKLPVVERSFNFNDLSTLESLVDYEDLSNDLFRIDKTFQLEVILDNERFVNRITTNVIEEIKSSEEYDGFYTKLNRINPKLSDVFSGAISNFELKIDNYAMNVAHSLRELINITLRELAPTDEVMKWLDFRENKLKNVTTKRGPTRKGRIFFLFRNHSKKIRRVMTKEADCLNELYNQLNKPSHTLPEEEQSIITKAYIDTVKIHIEKLLDYY